MNRKGNRWLLNGVFIPLSASAALLSAGVRAEPVLMYVNYKIQKPEMQKDADENRPVKLFKSAKGCEWVRFYTDANGENGSVSLWADRADQSAFVNSEAFKAVAGRASKIAEGGKATVRIHSIVKAD